jgi:hypothetical protein
VPARPGLLGHWMAASLALTAGFLFYGQSQGAGAGTRLVDGTKLAAAMTLRPISATEMLGGRDPAVSMGRWKARPVRALPAAAVPPAMVIRELPGLWRLETGPDVDTSAMDVRYHILSADGSGSCIGHEQDHDSMLCMQVRPRQPRIIDRDDRHTLIEGGVQLEIDLRSARRAGRYSGTLSYTVSVY